MKKVCFIAVVFILQSVYCYPYGELGHELVGATAKTYTNKAVIDSVNKYLAGVSWGRAAVWMDEVRSDHFYEYLRPSHYINIDKDSNYVKTDAPNIVNKLEEVINLLEHRSNLSKDKIEECIKILFHLVGDLHQPLHNGYGEDIGGNAIYVSFIGKETNLHSVWDTEIIEYHNKTIAQDIIEMSKKLTRPEIRVNQKIDVLGWMFESRSYLPEAYNFKKNKLNEEYAKKNIVIIEKQILKAGIRLSGILNHVFAN